MYLERRGQLPPRTHDLLRLGTLLAVSATVKSDLALINPTFGALRCPDVSGVAPVDAIVHLDAAAHVEAARRVTGWIREQF